MLQIGHGVGWSCPVLLCCGSWHGVMMAIGSHKMKSAGGRVQNISPDATVLQNTGVMHRPRMKGPALPTTYCLQFYGWEERGVDVLTGSGRDLDTYVAPCTHTHQKDRPGSRQHAWEQRSSQLPYGPVCRKMAQGQTIFLYRYQYSYLEFKESKEWCLRRSSYRRSCSLSKYILLHDNGVVEAFRNGQVDFQHAVRRKAVKVYIEPANSNMCCEY